MHLPCVKCTFDIRLKLRMASLMYNGCADSCIMNQNRFVSIHYFRYIYFNCVWKKTRWFRGMRSRAHMPIISKTIKWNKCRRGVLSRISNYEIVLLIPVSSTVKKWLVLCQHGVIKRYWRDFKCNVTKTKPWNYLHNPPPPPPWGRRGFKSRIRPPYPQRVVKGD